MCVCVCVLRAISAARVQARPRRRSGEKREWKTDGRDRSRRGDPGRSRDRRRLINGGQSEADGKRTIDLDRHGVPSHRQLFPCGFSEDSLTGTFSGSLARGALKRRECGKRGKGGRGPVFFSVLKRNAKKSARSDDQRSRQDTHAEARFIVAVDGRARHGCLHLLHLCPRFASPFSPPGYTRVPFPRVPDFAESV